MGLKDLFKKNTDEYQIISTEDGLVEAKIKSLKWGEDFSLMSDVVDRLPYAQKCLDYLDNLPQDVEDRLRKYIVRYYKDFEQYLDEDELTEMGVVDETTVFDHIHIKSVIVDDDSRPDIVEFHVEGNCDWEPEHGLEFTISDGKILYVGPFDDNPPNSERLAYALENFGYYDPDADPSMNYADKE
ncbi:DUF6985 domain-containing protein [Pseudobutyrivibrio sp.]